MTAARRYLPTDPADLIRSLVPLALLVGAAAIPGLRIPVLIGLVLGAAIGIARGAPVRWAWAAGVPVAASLAWGGLAPPLVAVDGSDCADPGSPIATWRLLEAVIVLAVLGAVAVTLGASRHSLGLRWPARRFVHWAIVGFLVAGPLGLVLGPLLARPFFGEVGYDLTILGAIVPALVFAVANGVMEEVAYRGALLGWSAKVMGLGPAVVGQAVAFGIAHSGTDVIGAPLPLMVLMGVGGLLAGIIAIRTRSLLVPIAVHVGFDIPIYYALACR